MENVHEPVKTCAQVGHVYSTTLVVRCQHTEAYTARSAVWVDTADGETHLVWERIEEFGPFDDHGYIRNRVGAMMEFAAVAQMEHEKL